MLHKKPEFPILAPRPDNVRHLAPVLEVTYRVRAKGDLRDWRYESRVNDAYSGCVDGRVGDLCKR